MISMAVNIADIYTRWGKYTRMTSILDACKGTHKFFCHGGTCFAATFLTGVTCTSQHAFESLYACSYSITLNWATSVCVGLSQEAPQLTVFCIVLWIMRHTDIKPFCTMVDYSDQSDCFMSG